MESDSMVRKHPILLRAVDANKALQTMRRGDRSIQAKIHFCEARARLSRSPGNRKSALDAQEAAAPESSTPFCHD
jgi:hypothetical protein